MGDSDVASSLYNGAGDIWRARVGAIFGWSGSDELWNASGPLPPKNGLPSNYKDLKMQMQIAALSAGLDAPWGTGLGLLVPYAFLKYEDWTTAPTKANPNGKPILSNDFGDPEIRVRQDVLRPFDLKPLSGSVNWPRIFATLGVVVPNKSAYSSDATKDLAISRGAWWLIAELEAHLELPQNFGLSLTGGWRTALTYATNGDPNPQGLGWGDEYRTGLSGRYSLDMPVVDGAGNYFVPKRLMFVLTGDFLYRNQSTVVENAEVGRLAYPDSGGRYINLTPTLMVGYNDSISATASARIPMSAFVNGEQPVQYTSWFFGLNYAWSSTPKPRTPTGNAEVGKGPANVEIEKLLVPGKITLVDYWATWCEPCGRLGVKIERELPNYAGVALARVDATNWEAEDWAKYLPGAPGIPVLDVYGRDGKLIVRLQGDDCFAYTAQLPADASSAVAP